MRMLALRLPRLTLLHRWLARLQAWWSTQSEQAAMRRTVLQLVQIADQLDGGGEYKRHQVYARLLKLYPDKTKRQLAWLIEDVLLEQERNNR